MSEVFRVNKTKDFTIMANHHLRNTNLSLRAKGLLSLMLSLPESWDYSLAGLSKISKEGVNAISSALKELEQECYLTRQRIRNQKGHLTGTEYIIYEKPIADLPNSVNPKLDNLETDKPILVNQAQSNTNLSSTYISNTELLNIYPSISPTDMIDRKAAANIFKENITYDVLCIDCGHECIDELLDILVETYCSTNQTIQILNKKLPIQVVKAKLMKLTMDHIKYVLFALSKNTTKIHNIRSYLLTCLYNAPSTMRHFYQAEVAHNLYGSQDDTA